MKRTLDETDRDLIREQGRSLVSENPETTKMEVRKEC
jgi:hypothetical protein